MKEISFADKTRKIVYPNGDQLSIFPNGSTLKETADGVQMTGTYQEGDTIIDNKIKNTKIKKK